MTDFASLNLSKTLLKTLEKNGYDTPTPIQAQAIPPVLEGRDLLGCAQTGTGKTAAFCLPMLQRLMESTPKGGTKGAVSARALILAPTRELAAQIEDSLKTYGRGSGLRGMSIYGGVKQFQQVRQLRAGVDVIVATPGRLLDLMEQGHVDLSAIEIFVLDEADRMLDMGFINPIREIGRSIPEAHQTLFFSATMPPKIRQLAAAMLVDPVSVSVTPVASAAPLIDQTLFHVPGEHKTALLSHMLEDPSVERTVVFTKTKHGAEKLAKKLSKGGVKAGAIHGNKTQAQRQKALDAFRSGRSRVLVATDVAARGLDVDNITHVFNYNLPIEPEAYVHRIGRTGRAGLTGRAISFCSREERSQLRAIEKLTGKRIDTTKVPEETGIPDETPAPSSGRRERSGGGPRFKKPRRSGGGYGNASGDRQARSGGAGKRKNRPGKKERQASKNR